MTYAIESENARIPLDGGEDIWGSLHVPRGARGIVLFAHGSGSGRYSPRNRFVARQLNDAGFGTLLVDLLTTHEAALDEQTLGLRFNIRLLADRLVAATAWTSSRRDVRDLAIGYFGASTGAAAALVAAAEFADGVDAVVSRGGRPDLAWTHLANVRAATLLLVGSQDPVVLDLNRKAMEQLRCPRELIEVEGAGHLFEEPGTLEKVAGLTARWFTRYLRGGDIS